MKKKSKSLKWKLMRYLLLWIFLLLAFGNFAIWTFVSDTAMENAEEVYGKLAYQMAQRIETELAQVEDTAIGVMFNTKIQNLLINPESLADYDSQLYVDEVMFDFRNFLDAGNIVIFSKDGQMILSSQGYDNHVRAEDFDWYDTVKESKGQSYWIPFHSDAGDYQYKTEEVLTLVKKIRRLNLDYTENSGKDIGYIMINIGSGDLNDILTKSRWNEAGKLYIRSQEEGGTIVPAYRDKKEHQLVFTAPIEDMDWKLVGTVPESEIMKEVNILRITILLVSAVLFLVAAITAGFLSGRISKPLGKLRDQMKNISLDFESPPETPKSQVTEIDDLSDSYRTMLARLKQLVEQVYEAKLREQELESTAKTAELMALQQQINPHFLYNTLDSINWLAAMEGNDDIVEMTTRLGAIFRYSTNKNRYSSIAEEMENVLDYIYIQKVRFRERLEVITDMDSSVMGYKTLRLILQPIVENAIIHGIEPSGRNGIIYLTVKGDENHILFSIKDNGVGITTQSLEKIQRGEEQKKDGGTEKGSIGLANVRKRIELEYQEKGGFAIHAKEREGTEVVIQIPKRK